MEILINIHVDEISKLKSVLSEIEDLRKEHPDAMYKINIGVSKEGKSDFSNFDAD